MKTIKLQKQAVVRNQMAHGAGELVNGPVKNMAKNVFTGKALRQAVRSAQNKAGDKIKGSKNFTKKKFKEARSNAKKDEIAKYKMNAADNISLTVQIGTETADQGSGKLFPE